MNLHVAKKYDVRWSSNGYFGYSTQYLQDLLESLGCYCVAQSKDSACWHPDDFECKRTEFEDAIKQLKFNEFNESNRKNKQVNSAMKDLAEEGYTKERIIEILEHMLAEGDPDEDYLHFSFY